MRNQKNHLYGETCIICSDEKTKGIHLYTSFICFDCERAMIHSETKDPDYSFYVHQLKKVTTPHIPS
ncbi:sigma factor G inhibitor Gin [Bacillus sp. 2205SS5-2]|uniref:sigma factor G inhibitor Gin n=1 Tax=Bacillus sp. 2205SS5-2 TaxID=3109031 RepID=UPI003006467F